ncbi:unnamed protein product [Haemonchus placei]|uniref:Uncharacterized protein n=1 Tax=Haemonchus placei TaxID=6290 RepID=A0A158QRS9_HAEPC|nr:unnamed protein product [Haemonchus placei]
MSTSTVLVLVLTTYLAFAEQNVKNATASGSYGYNQQYNEPSYDGGYNNYPSYFNGPYGPYGSYFPYGSTGPYGPYMPYGPPGPDPNVLKNNYVCSVDVAYGVYSANSRSRGGNFQLSNEIGRASLKGWTLKFNQALFSSLQSDRQSPQSYSSNSTASQCKGHHGMGFALPEGQSRRVNEGGVGGNQLEEEVTSLFSNFGL